MRSIKPNILISLLIYTPLPLMLMAASVLAFS